MFRKPRDQSTGIVPSVGRAPTPPSVTSKTKTMPRAAGKPKSGSQPRLSSFFSKATGPIQSQTTPSKQQNDSILKFFKKVDSPAYYERTLFIDGETPQDLNEIVADNQLSVQHDPAEAEELRFNEYDTPWKRRRTSSSASASAISPKGSSKGLVSETLKNQQEDHIKREESTESRHHSRVIPEEKSRGPFAEDSDSDEEPVKIFREVRVHPAKPVSKVEEQTSFTEIPLREHSPFEPSKPTLTREATSFAEEDGFDQFDDFEGEEFYENGEEFVERRYMEEQAALERELEEDDLNIEVVTDLVAKSNASPTPEPNGASEATCPICDASLKGISSEDASIHVNNCLDGNPSPLPATNLDAAKPAALPPLSAPSAKRFQRAAIPRPGQANPFSLAPAKSGSSAFSKLMSGHAEDEAWAAAAANEISARGKPAFKRTCPFYKILPGFFTCVDAFRYGAVEGCNAYFLSHFHSDHYIGLTASWCHGPIYCSRVTGNLVRQQLRVDPKWVVDLEWDTKFEIPNTQGVYVTMIPANHCPGSSLYLFEKRIGTGSDNRQQRVLHCGDFRACPAHVHHPLLRPDVVDAVSGKSRQQKLNVCYLDTTYLTPKYAFPPQEKVIKACADMCVSLSKDRIDEMDAWERTKRARAGNGMVKFIQKEANDDNSSELDGQGEVKRRGRLLVVVGTYSIGKERICLGIARALQTKIYAPPSKTRICLALEDPELKERLTDNPYEAQIHMQMLMEIRPETLADYLTEYKPHFSRVVGFRPTGWNYRPPNSRFVESPLVQTVLHSDNWKTSYSMGELVPQRGSTRESNCFGVPYSEHSSFRELTMFCCALRIDKIIPTVNVGSAKSREKMKSWIEKWTNEKKKNGLFKVENGKDW